MNHVEQLRELAACECARTAMHLAPDGEERPRIAIETAEAWVRGEANGEEVSAADAASYAAAGASYAAVDAACAAYYAAAAAAADASYADADAARARAHRECADIVRRHFPNTPELLEVVS